MPVEWSDNAERDLLVSMLIRSDEAAPKPESGWDAVEQRMIALGYDTNKGALQQRFSKVIMKKYKTPRTALPGVAPAAASGSGASTPVKKSKRKGAMSDSPSTPRVSKKAKKDKKTVQEDFNEEKEEEEGEV
ncbi:hypothetical protein F5Y15DRAFT_428279 [Xylariaceae sp. FL0016]|nr:hypothetical protein F5Y15DRAFT_428279 [Xylariaceae sp. FL0016]